jgi:carbamoylphosphate synthase large subunit
VNTAEAVRNSADKIRMKTCFDNSSVKTALWYKFDGNVFIQQGASEQSISPQSIRYPIVAKHRFGSRGTGNTLIKTVGEFNTWRTGKDMSRYIFERYLGYGREYRLHVTKNGVFYTCRKLLKEATPKGKRWYRNDSNCAWAVESNPAFKKPGCWDAIVAECVKALKAVGLDVGACDVKVQSKENPNFFVIEINSAPSFGVVTKQKYLEILPKLLTTKGMSNE